jgi:zinc resistance-associated protein
MKKILIAAALIGAIGFAGVQMATADAGHGFRDGSCRDYPRSEYNDEANTKAREKFMEETVALRKELAVKRGEYRALLQQDNPDVKRAATLSGELFDLRNELQQKALERGIPGAFRYGRHDEMAMMADDDFGRGRHHRRERMRNW